MWDEFVVFFPGVGLHCFGDGDGTAVVLDVGVWFRGSPCYCSVGGVFLGQDRAAQLACNIQQGATPRTLAASRAPRAVEECLPLKIAVEFLCKFYLDVVKQ